MSTMTLPIGPGERARPVSPLDPAACRALAASDRWAAKVTAGPGGCTLWTGGTTADGYARVRLTGRVVRAHRVAWVAAAGRDVPDGFVIDHRCRVRACVNPAHLDLVTPRENVARGVGRSAAGARTGHCPAGHPLAPGNLVAGSLARGQRACLVCDRARGRDRAEALAAAARALGLPLRVYVARYGGAASVAGSVLAAAADQPGLFDVPPRDLGRSA